MRQPVVLRRMTKIIGIVCHKCRSLGRLRTSGDMKTAFENYGITHTVPLTMKRGFLFKAAVRGQHLYGVRNLDHIGRF